MIVVNTETVPGHRVVEALGVVRGSTIRAKHIGKDIMASLRNIVGGEVKEYTEMLTETRNESVHRMKREAAALGADAVVNLLLHHVSGPWPGPPNCWRTGPQSRSSS